MIDFMNSISPSFVAFVLVLCVTPVALVLIHRSFSSAHEERKLRFAAEAEGRKMKHEETMVTIHEIEGRAIEHKKV